VVVDLCAAEVCLVINRQKIHKCARRLKPLHATGLSLRKYLLENDTIIGEAEILW